jgi:hypothetical protein
MLWQMSRQNTSGHGYGNIQLDISSAGEVLVALVERDMLCNLSRGGAGMHPTIIRTMLPFAVLQISQYSNESNMPLNRRTKQWSGRQVT